MPRDGAITFSDLIGKLDMLRVSCEKCGRDAKLVDWLDELTADCPKKTAGSMSDRCGARCQDLAKVL